MLIHEQMDQFSDLANELILMILEHLNLIDLINNVTLVSKRLHFLVDQIKFKELIVLNSRVRFENYWNHTFRPINLDRTIRCWNLELFKSTKFKNNLINLEHLKIDYRMFENEFNIEILNDFKRLKQLELNWIKLTEEKRICLPNLRVLKIESSELTTGRLLIDAIKLRVFYCDNLRFYQLSSPNSIEFLQINVGSEQLNSNFSNLEIFKCFQVLRLNRELLSKLSNLKELHLYSLSFNDLERSDEESEDLIIRHFVNEKKLQNKFDLNIFYNGVRLIDDNEIDDYFNQDLNELELVIVCENYEQLESTLPWFKSINYNSLMNSFENNLPDDFFQKFNNVKSVSLFGKTVEQNRFVAFLKECSSLSELDLTYPSFLADFYEVQLPNIACSLVDFNLRENHEIKLDYKFIWKFKLLARFATRQPISMQFALDSMNKLQIIQQFKFSNNKNNVVIEKFDRDCYSLKCDRYDANCAKAVKDKMSLEELTELCTNLEIDLKETENEKEGKRKRWSKRGKKRN